MIGSSSTHLAKWRVGLFDRSVAEIVKRYAALVGFAAVDFAGHSLRVGFLTSAAESGANIFTMMAVSSHKRVDTVRGYVHAAELSKDQAGG